MAVLSDMPFILSSRHRGFPSDHEAFDATGIALKSWSPTDGVMNLPVLSINRNVYRQNRDAIFETCKIVGAEIAPHIKTPMSPVLAADLMEHGAWAISVADLRQAAVMIPTAARILIANEIGGGNAARRLASLVGRNPRCELWLFVDSPRFVEELAVIWAQDASLPDIHLLIDIGCGRGGVRTPSIVSDIIADVAKAKRGLVLSGVGAYEGTLNGPDMAEVAKNIDELFSRCQDAMHLVRKFRGPEAKLIFSAGGSTLFDYVIVRGLPLVKNDGNATLVLRCGACFFSDHGPIHKRMVALADRNLIGDVCQEIVRGAFRPALRLWAEVLSKQDDGLLICGIGLRDAAHDQGLPSPLALWRNGKKIRDLPEGSSVSKLNDQHAFVRSSQSGAEAGDVIEFGISHPCTTLDKHSVIYVLDDQQKVIDAYETFFG